MILKFIIVFTDNLITVKYKLVKHNKRLEKNKNGWN